MKYLKLYEDFNSSDILEDIKWIMIEVSEDSKLISSELDDDLLFYNLNTDCSDEDLRVAKLRLNDLDYKIVYFDKNYCWIVNIDILSDEFKDSDEIIFIKSGEYASLKNLKINDNFKKLRRYLLFKYWEKTPILSHYILKLFLNKTDLAYGDDVFLSSLFVDFLGEERIEKILNEILEKNYYYDVSANGDLYDRESEFNFSFEIDDFSINVVEKNICVTCVVDYPGATITTNGNELEILDIYDDHETTTDDIQKIDDELESIMVEFIYSDLKVWERTGLSVEVEIANIN
jgi:hypothetical protein